MIGHKKLLNWQLASGISGKGYRRHMRKITNTKRFAPSKSVKWW